jgi:hypothetical protein
VIFAEMVKTEQTEHIIFDWLQTLGNHNYNATEVWEPAGSGAAAATADDDDEGDDDGDDDAGGGGGGGGRAAKAAAGPSASAAGAAGGPKKIRPWGKRNFTCYSFSCKERGSAGCYSTACRVWVNPWPAPAQGESIGGEGQEGGKKRKKWNPRGGGGMKWRKRSKK